MSCNTCRKPFSFFRKEKGCPNCGFSYCSNCLNNKVSVPEKGEIKVCIKCKDKLTGKEKPIAPPDAYFKRLEKVKENSEQHNMGSTSSNAMQSNAAVIETVSARVDDGFKDISERLADLKKREPPPAVNDIKQRLDNLKDDVKVPSEDELQQRLAKLRGYSSTAQNKPVIPTQDLRTEVEQADDLLKQCTEEANIEQRYNDEFDVLMKQMSDRIRTLKEERKYNRAPLINAFLSDSDSDYDDEVKDILKKMEAIPNVDPKRVPSHCPRCYKKSNGRCGMCHDLYCNKCYTHHMNHCFGLYRISPENTSPDESSVTDSSSDEGEPRKSKINTGKSTSIGTDREAT